MHRQSQWAFVLKQKYIITTCNSSVTSVAIMVSFKGYSRFKEGKEWWDMPVLMKLSRGTNTKQNKKVLKHEKIIVRAKWKQNQEKT